LIAVSLLRYVKMYNGSKKKIRGKERKCIIAHFYTVSEVM